MTPMAHNPTIVVDLQPRAVRTEILFVRVTKDERTAIATAAADQGMTMVAFIRAAMREKILAANAQVQAKRSKRSR